MKKTMKLGLQERPDCECAAILPDDMTEEITEEDRAFFLSVVSNELQEWQVQQVLTPSKVFTHQEAVLATHWHPEFVPMDLIAKRIESMYPGREEELIIPTQHNVLMSYGKYAGVEVDCYASGFNQKVQLLLHFQKERVKGAGVLKSMLAHTFQYRATQLFDFIHTITGPKKDRIERAARETGADSMLIDFVAVYVKKIEKLLDQEWERVPQDAIKNKLLRNFFDALRPQYGDMIINRAQAYLTSVKKVVKEHFSLKFFYRATEVIEEARSLGGGIIIPHPEQFWPILLAGYDVDGYEVWNPQSLRYTDFLISVLNEKNTRRGPSQRELLVFMGDDTHMGEKTKDPAHQDCKKAAREIGLQPPWDDMAIRKKLIVSGISRRSVIAEYKQRLSA